MGYSLATETDGFSISLFLEANTSMRNTDIYESYDDFVFVCVGYIVHSFVRFFLVQPQQVSTS